MSAPFEKWEIEAFDRFSRFSRWDRPEYPEPAAAPREKERFVDEFGLSYELYRYYPKLSRQYIATAIEHVGGDKLTPPIQQGIGTAPELVIIGGLLERDFDFQGIRGNRSFYFQSEELGGRRPGGAVVDVMVYIGGEKIGVRVQSRWHALNEPFFQGRAKVEEDKRQLLRLLSNAQIDRIVDVNQPPQLVLETGPDALVLREFDRIITGTFDG